MCSLAFKPATTTEHAASMALNAKASFANTPTASRTVWSNIIPTCDNDFFAVAAVCDRGRNLRHMLGAHRALLQLFHRVANIIERYILREICSADTWRDDEPDFSALEFFVESYRAENRLTRKFRRQTRWQAKSAKQINDRVALMCC